MLGCGRNMKSWKNRIEFFFIIIGILLIYIYLMKHVDYFITQYEGKTMEYPNEYQWEEKETMLRKSIYSGAHSYELMDEEMMDKLQENPLFLKLLQYNFNSKEKAVKKMEKGAYVKIPDTKYGDLIHLELYPYSYIFTEDLKNIYYHSYSAVSIYDSATRSVKYPTEVEMVEEKDPINKEQVLKNMNQILEQIELQEEIEFQPDSIYWKSYTRESDDLDRMRVYVAEDTLHNIKISYNVDTNQMTEFLMGF